MDRLWQMNGWLAREARFLNTNLELFIRRVEGRYHSRW